MSPSLVEPTQPAGGIEQLELEARYSLASSVEVKNDWNYTSAPSVCFHGVDRDDFRFTFIFYAIRMLSLFSSYTPPPPHRSKSKNKHSPLTCMECGGR